MTIIGEGGNYENKISSIQSEINKLEDLSIKAEKKPVVDSGFLSRAFSWTVSTGKYYAGLEDHKVTKDPNHEIKECVARIVSIANEIISNKDSNEQENLNNLIKLDNYMNSKILEVFAKEEVKDVKTKVADKKDSIAKKMDNQKKLEESAIWGKFVKENSSSKDGIVLNYNQSNNKLEVRYTSVKNSENGLQEIKEEFSTQGKSPESLNNKINTIKNEVALSNTIIQLNQKNPGLQLKYDEEVDEEFGDKKTILIFKRIDLQSGQSISSQIELKSGSNSEKIRKKYDQVEAEDVEHKKRRSRECTHIIEKFKSECKRFFGI